MPAKTAPLPQAPFHAVSVIGGGFCGASVARALALCGAFGPGEVAVFEPRAHPGEGLAYGGAEPALRLNVPASRMRVLPEDPEAFARFLEESGRLAEDPGAVTPGGVYARRADFAAFMRDVLWPFLKDGRIVHVRARVEAVCRAPEGWRIRTADGREWLSGRLVLAIGHPRAEPPAALQPLSRSDPRVLSDPAALGDVGAGDDVLIVGAGLTALDFLAALARRGHAGPVTLLCRSGLLPQPQAKCATEPFGDLLSPPPATARALLGRVRALIHAAEAAGEGWHSVFDTVRRQGQGLWAALPQAEKARFLRHLRRRYEMSRFRMPPQNEALLVKLATEGRLTPLAGRVEEAQSTDDGVAVSLRLKKGEGLSRRLFDRVAIATGPDPQNHFIAQGWLKALQAEGEIAPDPLGLGIACDGESRAIGADGQARDDLFIAGPASRGTFGEITGAPEIAAQAANIAERLKVSARVFSPEGALLPSKN